jgi:hypothetical protein
MNRRASKCSTKGHNATFKYRQDGCCLATEGLDSYTAHHHGRAFHGHFSQQRKIETPINRRQESIVDRITKIQRFKFVQRDDRALVFLKELPFSAVLLTMAFCRTPSMLSRPVHSILHAITSFRHSIIDTYSDIATRAGKESTAVQLLLSKERRKMSGDQVRRVQARLHYVQS